jgi:hypothetical protein
MDLLNPDTEKELTTKENYIERKEEILDTLFVKNSKLYYFLKRCLTKEAEKRSFLYI